MMNLCLHKTKGIRKNLWSQLGKDEATGGPNRNPMESEHPGDRFTVGFAVIRELINSTPSSVTCHRRPLLPACLPMMLRE